MRGRTAHRPLVPLSWNVVYANDGVDDIPIYTRMVDLITGWCWTVTVDAVIVKVWCEYVFNNAPSDHFLVNWINAAKTCICCCCCEIRAETPKDIFDSKGLSGTAAAFGSQNDSSVCKICF